MKFIDKIKNIKVNSKLVIIISILIIPIIIGFGINYCFYTPSPINRFIASNLYKTPANKAFVDDNFYQCVIDQYNRLHYPTKLEYTYNLSDKQLATITSLVCSEAGTSDDKKIKSTEGLEKLEALTVLDLTNNNITNIDVSNNENLKTLRLGSHAWGAGYGNQVTEINLTNNTKLEILDLTGNDINKLVIDKNVALKELYVKGNPLNELNVENNFELEILYIREKYSCRNTVTHFGCEIGSASKNLLTYLNLRENANLKELYVSGIGLTSLDLSNNFKLEKLSVDNNPLNDPLNLYNNTSLKYLTADGVELSSLNNNTQLTELSLVGNELKEINVTRLKELFALQLSANYLTSLDVRENTNLEYLDVSANQLTSLSVSNNPKLITLEVSGNQLTSLILSNNPNLTTLGVSDNQLTSLSVSNNPKLTTLNVSYNQLTSLILSNNPKLTYLHAHDNQLKSLDLSKNTELTRLIANNNEFNDTLPPVFVGEKLKIDINSLKKFVKLPKQLNLSVSVWISPDGLRWDNNDVLTTKPGIQLYQVNYNDSIANDRGYSETYYIPVVGNPESNKYTINGREYVYIGNDNYSDVLNNVSVENGELDLDGNNKLVIRSGTTLMATLDILRLNVKNSNYIFGDNYIYLNGESINSLSNNIEVLNGNEKVNADIKIENGSLIIKYNGVELENLKILKLSSDRYNIDENIKAIYIHTDDYSNIKDNVSCTGCNIKVDNENNSLKIMLSNKEVGSYKLIKLNLPVGVYNVTDKYIYIKNEIPDNFRNKVSVTNGTATIDSVTGDLLIKSGTTEMATVDILRLNITDNQYKIGEGYIYVFDDSNEDILNKVQFLNGNDIVKDSIRIVGDNLIIEYNGIKLDNFEIVKVTKNKYKVDLLHNYIYIKDDDYDDLKENFIVDNGEAIIDEDTGYLNVMYNGTLLNKYEIVRLNILDDNYILGNDYIYIGNNNWGEILNNVKLIRNKEEFNNGIKIKEDGYLKVSVGAANVFDSLKIITISSSVYDLSKDYIYVGGDSDIKIKDNINTIADNVTITNNVLSITYGTSYITSYKLIRLNKKEANYKIGNDYIYALNDTDETILNKVQLLYGNDIIKDGLSIVGDNLLVEYNGIELCNLKIIRLKINKYKIIEMSNFIYLGNDTYDDLRENVVVENGTFDVDTTAGHLRIMYNDVIELHRYEIFKFNIFNDSYILTDKYIFVGSDSYDDVSENIRFIRSGQEYTVGKKIEGGYLELSAGAIDFEKLKIIRISSSAYDLSAPLIYVGADTDETIKKNIETNGNITVDDYVLTIEYKDIYKVNYRLVRLKTKYDIRKGYIYTWDSDFLDNIRVTNGTKEVIDNNLVIKYNTVELDRIPILNLYSDDYVIRGDYIYTGLSDIDLSKITTSNDLQLSKNINKVILTYKGKVIDEIPYYYIGTSSDYIRFSSRENKIYVTNKMMMYRDFLSYIAFNYGNESIVLYDKNGKIITNQDDEFNYLVETGSYIVVKNLSNIKYYIEVNTNKVEYTPDADVYYTDQFRKDILKNLSINSTFGNVKNLIITSGTFRYVDKDENFTDESSTIKTGDKFAVVFPSDFNHYIYLSVKGDVTGKGNISDDDVLEAYSILRGKKVEDYYRFASDVTNDGQTRINDIAKLYHYVNNKIESLE